MIKVVTLCELVDQFDSIHCHGKMEEKTEKVKDEPKKKKRVAFFEVKPEPEDCDKNKTEEKNEDPGSILKAQVACPAQMLQTLVRQTDLTEHQINVRYMMFRSQYPTGFVGPNVLHDICSKILNEDDCDEYVDLVFRLYGQKKKGWGVKLIGFREVLLATEGIGKLQKPDDILRWIFRVYDRHARGEISVLRIESMVTSLLSLCLRSKKNSGADYEDVRKCILDYFASKLYDDHMISEEEFIYDGLQSAMLYKILLNSCRAYKLGNDEEEDEEEDENVDEELIPQD